MKKYKVRINYLRTGDLFESVSDTVYIDAKDKKDARRIKERFMLNPRHMIEEDIHYLKVLNVKIIKE